jgi:hypothetical protein
MSCTHTHTHTHHRRLEDGADIPGKLTWAASWADQVKCDAKAVLQTLAVPASAAVPAGAKSSQPAHPINTPINPAHNAFGGGHCEVQRLVEEINMSQRSQMRLDELHMSLSQMLQDLQKDATAARSASLTLTALAGGPPAAGAHLLYWYKSTFLLVQKYRY